MLEDALDFQDLSRKEAAGLVEDVDTPILCDPDIPEGCDVLILYTAEEWGVDRENIIIEKKARDTKDHPIYVKEIVGKDKFVLVRSASHMPRAMGLFKKHGMEPIPAPTDYMVTPVKQEKQIG
mgnify:CR=1 FL=1|jgi:uncharacterized SAM-binding protein YcdF (DUF218 family)